MTSGDDAGSGRLSPAARQSAIAAALPLLGSYFSSGTQELQTTAGPSRGPDDDIGRLLAALRLRVALAATGRLTRLAKLIALRPNFRYQRVRKETVGIVGGRLDISRYVTTPGRLQAPPRYPVIDVVRTQATPENTLLVCAAHWLLRELAQPSLLRALPHGPERAAARHAGEALRHVLADPLFAACRPEAREVMRLGGLARLASRVRHRLAGGHVAAPAPYRELMEWVTECLSGKPAARPGDLEWSFYGDAFDPKLFEIWCLWQLALAVGGALGSPPSTPDLMQRGDRAMFSWTTSNGTLEIHYQRSPATYRPGWPQLWRETGGARGLRGIPDISVLGRRTDGGTTLVLLDPKLRQRDRVASEELFKMLGYFEQYGLRGTGLGALLLYGNGDTVSEYATDEGGRLLETRVDPQRDEGSPSAAWAALASLSLQALAP